MPKLTLNQAVAAPQKLDELIINNQAEGKTLLAELLQNSEQLRIAIRNATLGNNTSFIHTNPLYLKNLIEINPEEASKFFDSLTNTEFRNLLQVMNREEKGEHFLLIKIIENYFAETPNAHLINISMKINELLMDTPATQTGLMEQEKHALIQYLHEKQSKNSSINVDQYQIVTKQGLLTNEHGIKIPTGLVNAINKHSMTTGNVITYTFLKNSPTEIVNIKDINNLSDDEMEKIIEKIPDSPDNIKSLVILGTTQSIVFDKVFEMFTPEALKKLIETSKTQKINFLFSGIFAGAHNAARRKKLTELLNLITVEKYEKLDSPVLLEKLALPEFNIKPTILPSYEEFGLTKKQCNLIFNDYKISWVHAIAIEDMLNPNANGYVKISEADKQLLVAMLRHSSPKFVMSCCFTHLQKRIEDILAIPDDKIIKKNNFELMRIFHRSICRLAILSGYENNMYSSNPFLKYLEKVLSPKEVITHLIGLDLNRRDEDNNSDDLEKMLIDQPYHFLFGTCTSFSDQKQNSLNGIENLNMHLQKNPENFFKEHSDGYMPPTLLSLYAFSYIQNNLGGFTFSKEHPEQPILIPLLMRLFNWKGNYNWTAPYSDKKTDVLKFITTMLDSLKDAENVLDNEFKYADTEGNPVYALIHSDFSIIDATQVYQDKIDNKGSISDFTIILQRLSPRGLLRTLSIKYDESMLVFGEFMKSIESNAKIPNNLTQITELLLKPFSLEKSEYTEEDALTFQHLFNTVPASCLASKTTFGTLGHVFASMFNAAPESSLTNFFDRYPHWRAALMNDSFTDFCIDALFTDNASKGFYESFCVTGIPILIKNKNIQKIKQLHDRSLTSGKESYLLQWVTLDKEFLPYLIQIKGEGSILTSEVLSSAIELFSRAPINNDLILQRKFIESLTVSGLQQIQHLNTELATKIFEYHSNFIATLYPTLGIEHQPGIGDRYKGEDVVSKDSLLREYKHRKKLSKLSSIY